MEEPKKKETRPMTEPEDNGAPPAELAERITCLMEDDLNYEEENRP